MVLTFSCGRGVGFRMARKGFRQSGGQLAAAFAYSTCRIIQPEGLKGSSRGQRPRITRPQKPRRPRRGRTPTDASCRHKLSDPGRVGRYSNDASRGRRPPKADLPPATLLQAFSLLRHPPWAASDSQSEIANLQELLPLGLTRCQVSKVRTIGLRPTTGLDFGQHSIWLRDEHRMT